MNRFLILWSLISPGCFGLVAIVFRPDRLDYPDIWRWSAAYLTYWLLLGLLQSKLLSWKFQNRQFAKRWFLTTSITGLLLMMVNHLAPLLLGVDRSYGSLALISTSPFLIILGGLILGFVQFRLIRNQYRTLPKLSPELQNVELGTINRKWFIVSFGSWVIGFGGYFFTPLGGLFFGRFGESLMIKALIWLLAIAAGTILKGRFIQRYLTI